jgi:L-asparaginase / beta-aspartyl-peptidase
MNNFSLAIHGGAGTLLRGQMTPAKEHEYTAALQQALDAGHVILRKAGSALDAVEAAVRVLEDCPLFNAGRGSVFTAEGTHQMDASIMEGRTRNAGAVSLITGIRNPISLARDVMEKSNHVFLAGEGAMHFAKTLGYTLEEPSYFHNDLRP